MKVIEMQRKVIVKYFDVVVMYWFVFIFFVYVIWCI